MNYSYGNQQNQYHSQSLKDYTQQNHQPSQYQSFNAPDNLTVNNNFTQQPQQNLSHLYQTPYQQQTTMQNQVSTNNFSNQFFQREHNAHIERQYHDRYRPIYQNKISKQEMNQIYENLNESRRLETPNQSFTQNNLPQQTKNRQPDFFMKSKPSTSMPPQISMQQQSFSAASSFQQQPPSAAVYQQPPPPSSFQPQPPPAAIFQEQLPPSYPPPPSQSNSHQLSLDKARKHFVNKQKKEEINFIDKQKKEYTQFKSKQSEKRMQYEKELNDFKELGINAYEVLQVTTEYTLESLRKAYKKQVLLHHPDKGGDPKHFDAITKSYIYLVEEVRKKRGETSHQTLKQGTKEVKTVPKTNKVSITVNEGGQFNQQLFNKLYKDNKIESVDDKGYDKWFKETKPIAKQTIKEPETFSESFNVSKFNDIFDHEKDTNIDICQRVIEYKDPVGVSLKSGISGEELGKNKINDFSNDNPASRLNFTDLKKAHTETNLINVNSVKQHNQYNNIKQLQHKRSNLQFVMTSQEKQRQQQIAQEKQQQEQERLKRLRERDYRITQKFQELNGHLLQ